MSFGANLAGLFNPSPAPTPVAPVAPQAPQGGNPFAAAGLVPTPQAPPPPQPASPAPPVSGFFNGIESARASEGGNYERAGHYIERINRIKIGRSRKERDFVVFEKTIWHVYDNCANQGHSVGEDVSHMLVKTGNEMFFPNMKSIFSSLAGCPSESVTPQIAEAIITQGLCNGMFVECGNRVITTKKGGLFTEIRYKKQVSPQELKAVLAPDVQVRLFPNGELDAAVAAGRPRV